MPGPQLLNHPDIPTRVPDLSELFFFANPTTGLGGKNVLSVLVAMIAENASAPIKSYATVAAMLANTTIPVDYFAFINDNGSGLWALYIFKGPTRSNIAHYVLLLTEGGGGGSVANVWLDCGVFNTDAYPSAGGSGGGGAIMRGNTFDAGDSGTGPGGALGVTVGTTFYPKGTTFRSLVDTPGATDANWRIHS